MWQNLLDKGKCFVGLHQGDWTFLHENDCTSVRICSRCGTENRKTEHSWSVFDYVKEQVCDQQRSCRRCNLTEDRVVHEWQDAVWKSSDSCDRVEICSRCKAEQEASAAHTWAGWNYISQDGCAQSQVCERCGSVGKERRTEHLWGEWQHSEAHGGAVRVCRRCGELTAPKQPLTATGGSGLGAPKESVRRLVSDTSKSAADVERAQMFEKLKPKMSELGDLMNALGGVMERMGTQAGEETAADRTEIVEDVERGTEDQVERDPRLVGHWRFTDAMSSGGGFSQATDYHRVLEADGSFVDRSHTAGSFGENWSDPEFGRWRTNAQILQLNYSDGSERTLKYHLEGDTLFFPSAQHQRLWQRVG